MQGPAGRRHIAEAGSHDADDVGAGREICLHGGMSAEAGSAEVERVTFGKDCLWRAGWSRCGAGRILGEPAKLRQRRRREPLPAMISGRFAAAANRWPTSCGKAPDRRRRGLGGLCRRDEGEAADAGIADVDRERKKHRAGARSRRDSQGLLGGACGSGCIVDARAPSSDRSASGRRSRHPFDEESCIAPREDLRSPRSSPPI